MSDPKATQKNVLGGSLVTCSKRPLTGFFRDGCCNTAADDAGAHVVCASLTAEFLAYSKRSGNDLSTPRPEHGFPGLKPGDRWCLCGARWKEAHEAGVAPRIFLKATNEAMLALVPFEDLVRYALDVD